MLRNISKIKTKSSKEAIISKILFVNYGYKKIGISKFETLKYPSKGVTQKSSIIIFRYGILKILYSQQEEVFLEQHED